ncbi:MAG TPA: CpsD/CapB family tyrosine-protein kinase [Candidatus Acidoferrales bacterium]|nr:CpsD/CapB family tyrosine-protein kinase [Candidatus Acidoferrales bacterium]
MSRNFEILNREPAPRSEFRPARPVRPNGNGHSRDHRAAAEDEIEKLVQRVFILPGASKAPAVVAFCGVDQGSGCSWVCARASEALAGQIPGKVCIIDANLRSPSLDRHFRFETGAGFAEAIKESRPIREFARPVRGNKLWLITSGAVGRDANGALNPARLRARFAELRGEFDYVLIDTPPVSSYSDAALLGQFADGVILIIGSNFTRREPARIAKESLEAAKVVVLGAVLNRRTYPIPEALYQRL